VLNLFAYTGGSNAGGGDCRRRSCACGRREERCRAGAAKCGRRPGLADAPIRWIVEDAVKFCRREVKRGNHYDAVILDPPSYGHGPKGEEWSIKRSLLPLLELCGELTVRRPKFVLLTCHTPGNWAGGACRRTWPTAYSATAAKPPRTGELYLETAGRPAAAERGVCAVAWVNLAMPWRVFQL